MRLGDLDYSPKPEYALFERARIQLSLATDDMEQGKELCKKIMFAVADAGMNNALELRKVIISICEQNHIVDPNEIKGITGMVCAYACWNDWRRECNQAELESLGLAAAGLGSGAACCVTANLLASLQILGILEVALTVAGAMAITWAILALLILTVPIIGERVEEYCYSKVLLC